MTAPAALLTPEKVCCCWMVVIVSIVVCTFFHSVLLASNFVLLFHPLPFSISLFLYVLFKAWDMHSNGIKLDVYHNSHLDGKRNQRAGGYLKYWQITVKKQFPEALERCEAFIKAGNR